MGPFPSADLTPAYPSVAPLGLDTGDVESFTGYVVRLGNAFAVPASVLLTHSLNAVLPPARRDLHYRRNGALNGAGPAVLHAADGIARLTGERDAQRLSFHGLVDLLHLVDRDLVSPTRRWCPLCWTDDSEPYDRKVWWFAVVDACPVHGCLLESRCGTCGRLQPSLTRGVPLNACSYCGHELSDSSSATVLPSGHAAQRLLWYARQGADLIHAAEVVALMQSDEAASLNAAYARFCGEGSRCGSPRGGIGVREDAHPSRASCWLGRGALQRVVAPRRGGNRAVLTCRAGGGSLCAAVYRPWCLR